MALTTCLKLNVNKKTCNAKHNPHNKITKCDLPSCQFQKEKKTMTTKAFNTNVFDHSMTERCLFEQSFPLTI